MGKSIHKWCTISLSQGSGPDLSLPCLLFSQQKGEVGRISYSLQRSLSCQEISFLLSALSFGLRLTSCDLQRHTFLSAPGLFHACVPFSCRPFTSLQHPTSFSFPFTMPLATTFIHQRSSFLIRRPFGKILHFWNGQVSAFASTSPSTLKLFKSILQIWLPEWVFLGLQCPLSVEPPKLFSVPDHLTVASPTPLLCFDLCSGGYTMYPSGWVSVLWFQPMNFYSLSNAYSYISKALSK